MLRRDLRAVSNIVLGLVLGLGVEPIVGKIHVHTYVPSVRDAS